MVTVAVAAAIVLGEVGADDPLDVAVVAVELVAELVVVAVELVAVKLVAELVAVAVEGPAVEGGEGVALGECVVEQWVVVRRVGAAPAPGCGSP